MPLEFAAEEGCALAAARVARFLGAEQDQVVMWAGPGGEGRGKGQVGDG